MSPPELIQPLLDGDPVTLVQACSLLCCFPGIPMAAAGTLWLIKRIWGKGDPFEVAEAIGGKELADSLIESVEDQLPPKS